MNEVVKVSIAGIAFIFDNEAYLAMKEYLDKLNAGYARNPDGREIVADIEARVAELILSEQESDRIVGKPLVEGIIAQLGFPDDMDTGEEIPTETIPKRLYRNPEGAILGGVCSGLGAYFRVDPVWIRLGIFMPVLLTALSSPLRWGLSDLFGSLFGVFILLYLILWIAIPMARTPRQKLEMRGEKITASSIRQEFREDAQAMSPSPKRERSQSVWADLMYGLGRVLQIILKIFVIFFAFIFGIVAVSLLVALLAVAFSGNLVISGITLEAFSPLVGISPAVYAILLVVVVLIPILVIGYMLIKVIFGSTTNKAFLTTMGAIWLLVLIFLAAVTLRNADNLRDGVKTIIEDIDTREKLRHDPEDWDEERWRMEWDSYSGEQSPEQDNTVDTEEATEQTTGEQWNMEVRESGVRTSRSRTSGRGGRIRITDDGVDIRIVVPDQKEEAPPVSGHEPGNT